MGCVNMIKVTRFNSNMITINAEIVETIEETPDTVITLTNGKKYIVQESLDEVIKLIIEYKRSIFYKYIEKI
ncbi:MAG: flbD [Clostridiales bacterium]|nr:flbD [Clostridiales bacterium]